MNKLKQLGKQVNDTVAWASRQPPPVAVDDVEVNEELRNDEQLFETAVDEMERQIADVYPNHLPSRDVMRACLRCRRYQPFLATPLCEKFITFRMEYNWPFAIKASQVESALRSNIHWSLQGRDKLGRGILVMNARFLLDMSCSPDLAQMMGVYLMQQLSEDADVQEQGIVFIIDMRDTPLSVLTQFSITDWRRGTSGQRWFPARLKAFYFVNMSSGFSPFVSLSLKAVHEKMRSRIKIFKDHVNQLHEFIDPSVLPPEFGGTSILEWDSWVDAQLRKEADNQIVLL